MALVEAKEGFWATSAGILKAEAIQAAILAAENTARKHKEDSYACGPCAGWRY